MLTAALGIFQFRFLSHSCDTLHPDPLILGGDVGPTMQIGRVPPRLMLSFNLLSVRSAFVCSSPPFRNYSLLELPRLDTTPPRCPESPSPASELCPCFPYLVPPSESSPVLSSTPLSLSAECSLLAIWILWALSGNLPISSSGPQRLGNSGNRGYSRESNLAHPASRKSNSDSVSPQPNAASRVLPSSLFLSKRGRRCAHTHPFTAPPLARTLSLFL
jgi:hypothetical protein